jgi:HAMP domain-containing protein
MPKKIVEGICPPAISKLVFYLIGILIVALCGTVIINRVSSATNYREMCANRDNLSDFKTTVSGKIKDLEIAISVQDRKVDSLHSRGIATTAMLEMLLQKEGFKSSQIQERIEQEKQSERENIIK